MVMRTGWGPLGLVAAVALVACGRGGAEPIGAAEGALSGPAREGRQLFDEALRGTNGRSCATCHVEEDHTALLPASVAARQAVDPALRAHSQIDHDPPPALIDHIAAYERTVFSDPAAAAVAEAVEHGQDPPDVDPALPPGSDAAAGKALFAKACAPCHGGETTNRILDPATHDMLFPVLSPDGSVALSPPLPDGTVVPAAVRHDHRDDAFLNIGIAAGTYLTQVGLFPNPLGLDFPRYRLRFYTDATRTKKVVDLPPPPPLAGPNLQPQAFSVDPGRAVTSGDPADFEAFKVNQLRGIKSTPPYFHDGLAPDLPAVVDIYSRFILPQLPPLGLPRVVPPAGPGLPPESLTAQQKAQLVAYLETL